MFKAQLEGLLGRDMNSVSLVFRCRCPETGALWCGVCGFGRGGYMCAQP